MGTLVRLGDAEVDKNGLIVKLCIGVFEGEERWFSITSGIRSGSGTWRESLRGRLVRYDTGAGA